MSIPSSRYLKAMQSAGEAHRDSYYLVGSTFLVELIPDEAKTKEIKKSDGSTSKLYTGTGTELNSAWKNTTGLDIPLWARILDVGSNFEEQVEVIKDDDGNVIEERRYTNSALPLKPGQIVQMPRSAVQWFRNWGSSERYELNTIGIADEASVRIVFDNDDAYRSYYKSFDKVIQEGE